MPAPLPRWEHFEHGADIGVRGVAASLADAFTHAALALTAVVTDPSAVRAQQCVDVHCEAPDAELLLYEWLNAVVYEMATRRMLFGRYEVALRDGARLEGKLWGEAVDLARHAPAVEVKGATLTAAAVTRDDNGLWTAQCVVDV